MIELSEPTKTHVAALFQESDATQAQRLLAQECGETLPLMSDATPQSLERVRFAVIRLSGGRLDRLRDALCLARRDWRDLLMAARFAEDVQAHLKWKPQRFDARVAQDWLSGTAVAGVKYAPNELVSVSEGLHREGNGLRNTRGMVVALAGVEPVPRAARRRAHRRIARVHAPTRLIKCDGGFHHE